MGSFLLISLQLAPQGQGTLCQESMLLSIQAVFS